MGEKISILPEAEAEQLAKEEVVFLAGRDGLNPCKYIVRYRNGNNNQTGQAIPAEQTKPTNNGNSWNIF